MGDKIFIQDLHIPAIIGCNANEKTSPQPLIFDIEMTTDFKPATEKDELKNTINYAQVVEVIKQYVHQSRYNLIETLAETLAQQLFSQFNPKQITLKITKPEAIPGVPQVGVIVTR